jgi:integrase
MPRVATKLSPTKGGGFTARKRIPEDVQADYERLYGVRWEARLGIAAGTPVVLARAKHREWLSEIESRVANIRAERKGDGRSLTPKDARALSGDWYRWFTERHLQRALAPAHWEDVRERVGDALRDEVLTYSGSLQEVEEVDEIWERSPEVREDVRPMLADWGEVAQFLHTKRLVLDEPSRKLFLDYLYGDFAAALKLLIQRARGDYTPDTYPVKFPKFDNTDTGPWKLFESYVSERGPAKSTINRWRAVFQDLERKFAGPEAQLLTVETTQAWADGLVSPKRSQVTVRDVWVSAANTVYAWAKLKRLVSDNPFADVHVTVPPKIINRENPAFTAKEARTILRAAYTITNTVTAFSAAKRWVPWLCAYSGARVGEITQMRGCDIEQRGKFHVMRITPDAGTVKTRKAHSVPLHEHLIEQGFLNYVAKRGKGPLFYEPEKVSHAEAAQADPMKPKRPRAVKARERLADWVRGIGIDDPEVQPNHAWRDTFKQIAERHGISERIHDAITDHKPKTIGRGHGPATVEDMAKALEKFPRYEV